MIQNLFLRFAFSSEMQHIQTRKEERGVFLVVVFFLHIDNLLRISDDILCMKLKEET